LSGVRSQSQTEASVGETLRPRAEVSRNASVVKPNETRNAAQGPIDPVNASTRPSGFSARAATGAQARSSDDRAQFATAPNPQNEPVPDVYDDGGAPIGPSEEEEAAFLASEQDSSSHSSGVHLLATSTLASAATGVQARAAHVEDNEKQSGPLPSLEELRAKISPEVLGLMEELFRAKLTRVTRVNPRDLKEVKRSH